MAYVEVGSIGVNEVLIRFRQLHPAGGLGDYNEFQVDLRPYDGGYYGSWIYIDIDPDVLSFYTDGTTGYYRTNWITILNLDEDTQYRLFAYAVTNDTYPIGSYVQFTTDVEDVPLEYPNVYVGTITSTSIAISWGTVSGAIEYDVFLDGQYKGTTSTGSSSRVWTFTGLTPNTWYSFYVEAWNGDKSSDGFFVLTQEKTLALPATPTGLYVQGVTASSINYNWNSVSGAIGYDMEFRRVGYTAATSYTTNNYKEFTGLLSLTAYELRIRTYNNNGESAWTSWIRGTTLTGRPANWAWEYTIVAGGNFYLQSSNLVYLMRAAHWNDFIARINLFRVYKLLANYSFTSATTSTTEVGIRTCINQAITAINAMGFAQPLVTTGQNVTASIFLTMRNNLNSIV